MANKDYIPNENTADFICRINEDIVVNKNKITRSNLIIFLYFVEFNLKN